MEAPLPNGQLGCLNCKKPIAFDGAKTFLTVFVCQECHDYAAHFRATLHKQLQWLLLMADDAIREALTKGELHPGTAQPTQDISKSELLRVVDQMMEVKHVARSRADGGHPGTTALPAPAPGAAVREDNR